MRDTPAIASSSYTTTAIPLAAFVGNNLVGDWNQGLHGQVLDNNNLGSLMRRRQDYSSTGLPANYDKQVQKQEIPMAAVATRRLVKVVIVDPNENIPLDQCLLYSGEEKLTDATDQELFFEIDIKDILAKHNEKRAKIVDKKVKERTEYLEPAKIRDLKMVVVNIAQF